MIRLIKLPELAPIMVPKRGVKKSGKRFYVAGPMRGYDKWNFPAFDAGRNLLLAEGHEVISPADLDRARGINEETTVFEANEFQVAIRIDTIALLNCTGIYLLTGWENSTGAKYEHHVAKTFGLEIRFEPGATTDDIRVTRWPREEERQAA